MSEPGRMGLENALQGARAARDPLPLTVIATGPNEVTGEEEVVFEDPDGLAFSVPMSWMGDNIDPRVQLNLKHTDVSNAPPGALEEAWRKATVEAVNEQGGDGGFGGGEITSLLDDWKSGVDNSGNRWKLDREKYPNALPVPVGDTEAMKAAFGGDPSRSGVKTSSEALQRTPAGWRPTIPPAKAPTIRRKEDIPPDAGSGWGGPDDTWNPKTQRWEKKRGSR